jgi:glycosyltransferase involved in cell wall biosynthesis
LPVSAVRPKVLHVTQATGGLETILLLLFKHYDRSRLDLELACAAGTSLETKARALGVPVHPVEMVRSPNPIRDVGALVRLCSIIRKGRYDIVHGHSAKGGYLARLAARLSGRSKTVYSPQAFSYLSQQGLSRSVFHGLERLAVSWTDLVVASSQSEKKRAVQEVGFPESRVTVIPNSVDFSDNVIAEKVTPSAEPVVLTVGRFAYQKNLEMFVRVAAIVLRTHPLTQFVILGAGFAGPLEATVRAAIQEADLAQRVRILPWATREEALKEMARAHVFVLTSRFEGMPNTLLEALMLGKPAVVTDVDGSRDVLQAGGGGFIVPLDDDRAMARKIIQLLDDPSGARAIGEKGQAAACNVFDIRTNVRALGDLYARLVS